MSTDIVETTFKYLSSRKSMKYYSNVLLFPATDRTSIFNYNVTLHRCPTGHSAGSSGCFKHLHKSQITSDEGTEVVSKLTKPSATLVFHASGMQAW